MNSIVPANSTLVTAVLFGLLGGLLDRYYVWFSNLVGYTAASHTSRIISCIAPLIIGYLSIRMAPSNPVPNTMRWLFLPWISVLVFIGVHQILIIGRVVPDEYAVEYGFPFDLLLSGIPLYISSLSGLITGEILYQRSKAT